MNKEPWRSDLASAIILSVSFSLYLERDSYVTMYFMLQNRNERTKLQKGKLSADICTCIHFECFKARNALSVATHDPSWLFMDVPQFRKGHE